MRTPGWLLDPDLARDIAGDLLEQRRRRAARSRLGAPVWHLAAWMGIVGYVTARRAREWARRTLAGGFGPGGGTGDLRRTIRSLARSPGFTATTVGLMALTMALAVTVFAIVDGVLFLPLSYPHADRLFAVAPGFAGINPTYPPGASALDVRDWAAASPGVAFTAYRAQPWEDYGTGVNANAAGVASVQANFFDVIGVHPMMGGFAASDFEHREPLQPVVIMHGVWTSRFQGDPDVVGRTVVLDPSTGWGFRIVGVMPPGFVFPSVWWPVDFIAPEVLDSRIAADPTRRVFFEVIARAPAGMGATALRARVETGMRETARAFPPQGARPPGYSASGWRQEGPFERAGVTPLRARLGQRNRPMFLATFWAAMVLVVLGALNVAGLMAARALDRAREFAIRGALGATRTRLARLIGLESCVLAFGAAALGVAAATPLLHFALTLLPEDVALYKAPAIDGRTLVFAALLAVGLMVATAVWPMRRALSVTVTPQGDVGRASERVRTTSRWLVIASQVGGAFVLTVTGALLVGSLLAVYGNDVPVDTAGVVGVRAEVFGQGRRPDTAQRLARLNIVVDRVRQLPGVTGVAVDGAQLLVGGDWSSAFGAPDGAPNPRLQTSTHPVSAGFYRTVGLHAVAGRLPTPTELATNAPVVVVSQAVARAYWAHGAALGQTLTTWRDHTTFTVVGIVPDVRWLGWDQASGAIYGPYARLSNWPFPWFLVRTEGHTGRLLTGVLQTIRNTDPQLRPVRAATLDDLFVDSVRPRRFRSWLFGSFAAAALVVVGVGILGLIASSTVRRTREMGIRFALGATRDSVLGLIVREQTAAVAAGLVAGGLLSAWLVRLLKSSLYGVTVYDLRVWIAAATLMLGVTMLGAIIPAWRASRVDPVQALRTE
jgi:putative ABC transport system permease protein